LFKLLFRAKKYLPYLVSVVTLLFVITMCDLFIPFLMRNLVDEGINQGDTAYIMRTGFLMIGVSIFAVSCQILASYLSVRASMGFGRDLRSETFGKITHLSLQQSEELGTSSLIMRTSGDVREMQGLLQGGLNQVVSVPLHMIGGIIMALSINVPMTLIFAVAMPMMLGVVLTQVRWVRPLFVIMREKLDSVSRVLREILSGVRVIRAFDTTADEHARFNETNLEFTDANRKARIRMALMGPITTIIMSGATLAVYWFGGFQIESDTMTIGDVMAFATYIAMILGTFWGLRMIFNMIPRAMVSAQRLNEVLVIESSQQDPENPVTPTEGIYGEVRFENVTFRYPGAEIPVLRDITFEAKPGQTTAIIGGTGSGKTTLVSLIPRLYDIQEGTISINRTDITKMKLGTLRRRIGFISQKAQLFTGSVADNIRFGVDTATDEDMQKTADIAQASEFIDLMTDKYDSFVSQHGTNLSGGQKQRLSIARAVIRNPEIYIFDDSFSAVDFRTESLLRASLKGVTQNAAVIIVAQRVSTIIDADNIIVLDSGRCVGQGKHTELMQTCEVYREIVRSQLREEEIA
jgi:ATP-binding cassette subfamily B protein